MSTNLMINKQKLNTLTGHCRSIDEIEDEIISDYEFEDEIEDEPENAFVEEFPRAVMMRAIKTPYRCPSMVLLPREIEYIKRLFHIPSQYSGIDVALDCDKVHKYFNNHDMQQIRRKCEYVLKTEFKPNKYEYKYSYDEYADNLGYCAHHISFNKK